MQKLIRLDIMLSQLFDLTTGKSIPSKKPKPVSYSKIFGQTLLKICEQDSKVVGITAAMATGTGLDFLQKNIPDLSLIHI